MIHLFIYNVLSVLFYYKKKKKKRFHHFNYNHLRVELQPSTFHRIDITQRRGYVTDPYLRSVYFQKLGCQEAQVTDTIIPFFLRDARWSKDAWFYMVNVPGNVNLSANRIRISTVVMNGGEAMKVSMDNNGGWRGGGLRFESRLVCRVWSLVSNI